MSLRRNLEYIEILNSLSSSLRALGYFIINYVNKRNHLLHILGFSKEFSSKKYDGYTSVSLRTGSARITADTIVKRKLELSSYLVSSNEI